MLKELSKDDMELNLQLPASVVFNIDERPIIIRAFNSSEAKQTLSKQAVNIIASGPSVAHVAFSNLVDMPTIFVNGSISLLTQHKFTQVVGWVISDALFIAHQPKIVEDHYAGQPLYATLAVFEAIAVAHPDIMLRFHNSMRILYPVDRPWGVKSNKLWFSKLTFKKKLLNKRRPLTYFVNDPNFVIDDSYKPAAIGVSLNVTHGFVEAGTVAYVAAQLAFSRQAGQINLYGMDLINSSQPRFYEDSNNNVPTTLDKVISNRIVPSFNLLGKTYKAHGVMVINHSHLSKDLFNSLY